MSADENAKPKPKAKGHDNARYVSNQRKLLGRDKDNLSTKRRKIDQQITVVVTVQTEDRGDTRSSLDEELRVCRRKSTISAPPDRVEFYKRQEEERQRRAQNYGSGDERSIHALCEQVDVFHITTSSLMGLPGELRNQIYRHVLVEKDEILLDQRPASSNTSMPGLLRTSRQIRKEAMMMFFLENGFRIVTIDYKLEPRLTHWIWSSPFGTRIGVKLVGLPIWRNIKTWLMVFYVCYIKGWRFARRLQMCPIPGSETPQLLAFTCAFQLVAELAKSVKDTESVGRILEVHKASIESQGRFKFV